MGVLIKRILLSRVLYWGPLFSETPILKGGLNQFPKGLSKTLVACWF